MDKKCYQKQLHIKCQGLEYAQKIKELNQILKTKKNDSFEEKPNINEKLDDKKNPENPETLYEIVNNPYYIAPEIVLKTGYSHSVDIYAFGILAFWLTTGGL